MPIKDHALVRKALTLEYLTVAWNVFEGAISIGAGVAAGSVALVGFGLDSLIEVIAAGTLIWRLKKFEAKETEGAEEKARRVIAVTFFLLAAYVGVQSMKGLWLHEAPAPSKLGIAVTALAAVVMPILGLAKRKVGRDLGSKAFQAEATESMVCAMLSVIVLVGLVLNFLFHWWWADPVAGLGIVWFLIREGREASEGATCC